jgi:formylmethanofuran dehydrogenase subunit E
MKFKRPKILSYKDTIRFHGHSGPFLALGYRLGKHLNEKLKPKGIMDLKITVKTRTEKPFTCLIDGLQCSTFATIGKGTMAVKQTKVKDIIVVVEKGKQTYRCRITEKAMALCLTAENLETAAKKILRTPLNDLWIKTN